MKQERQSNLIVVTDTGKLEVLHLAGEFVSHAQCNATHESKTGDRIHWHKTDMYHTKVEGQIIEWQHLDWDYSLPLGMRASNKVQSEFFDITLKRSRSQNDCPVS